MSTKHQNNYELANGIFQLFDNDKNLPDRRFNTCLSCSNATWYKTSSRTISATCSKMNVVVYRDDGVSDKGSILGLQVCSGNPHFQPEKI